MLPGTTFICGFVIFYSIGKIVMQEDTVKSLNYEMSHWAKDSHRDNIWLSLARAIGKDTLCLEASNPNDPFQSCLIGVPWDHKKWEWFVNNYTPFCASADYIQGIFLSCYEPNKPSAARPPNPPSKPLSFDYPRSPPQEIRIKGSLPATHCFHFVHSRLDPPRVKVIVSPEPRSAYLIKYRWCTSQFDHEGQFSTPRRNIKLPPKTYLICGDRMWTGIPAGAVGGPCSFGQMTVLAPDRNSSSLIKSIKSPKTQSRMPRGTSSGALPFPKDCDSALIYWTHTQMVFGSIFAPIGTAKALKMIEKLGCWISKEVNATTDVLEDLLKESQTLEKTSMQNRAAIDFLLLAHGHGCEEFEGMCCMNFSNKPQSIHNKIQNLKSLVNDIQAAQDSGKGGLFDWFPSWNITKGLKQFIVILIMILVVIVLVFLVVSCVFTCFKKIVFKSVSANPVIFSKDGGNVGELDLDLPDWKDVCEEDRIENISVTVDISRTIPE